MAWRRPGDNYLTNVAKAHRIIYASLGLNVLSHQQEHSWPQSKVSKHWDWCLEFLYCKHLSNTASQISKWQEHLNSSALRRFGGHCNLLLYVLESVHELFLWNCSWTNATEHLGWDVNIGLGNGLVQSGNQPSAEPMMTQISVTTWCHNATMA